MRKTFTLVAVMLLTLGTVGGPALADNDSPLWESDDELDSHSHTLDVDAPQGDILFLAGGQDIDGQSFDQGETAEGVLLAVDGLVNNEGDLDLALVFDGRAPSDDEYQAGENVGQALLDDGSYEALDAAVGVDNTFTDDVQLFTGDLTIDASAEPGDWDLRWHVVEVDDGQIGQTFFSQTSTVTVNEAVQEASVFLHGPDSLDINEQGEYDVLVTNESDTRDLDDWALGLSVDNIDDVDDITITYEGGTSDLSEGTDGVEAELKDGILWLLGSADPDIAPGETEVQPFEVTFHTDGSFTGTAYVVDTSDEE